MNSKESILKAQEEEIFKLRQFGYAVTASIELYRSAELFKSIGLSLEKTKNSHIWTAIGNVTNIVLMLMSYEIYDLTAYQDFLDFIKQYKDKDPSISEIKNYYTSHRKVTQEKNNECKNCLNCSNSFTEPARNDDLAEDMRKDGIEPEDIDLAVAAIRAMRGQKDTLRCMKKDAQPVDEDGCCDDYT